jgi:hypothetical protein
MKKPAATKCRDHRAINLNAHAARAHRTGTKRKMTGVIGEYYLDLEEDKELGLSVGC